MYKHPPLSYTLYGVIITLFLNVISFDLSSQCLISNPLGSGTTFETHATDVGQSFTVPTICTGVSIGSITVYSTSSHTDATLEIYEGDGFDGAEIYSGSVNLNAGGNMMPSVLNVDPDVPVDPGHVYTFRITIPGTSGASLILLKSEFDTYLGGSLFEDGDAVQNQDLFFMANMTAAAMPVELTAFSARLSDNRIALNWQTASELNNEGFEIERSPDGESWKIIGFEKGHGSTTEPKAYRFYDETPLSGANYYRLRQIDFSGDFEFSGICVVNFNMPDVSAKLLISPNPARPGSTLAFSGPAESASQVRLMDSNGKILTSVKIMEGNTPALPLPADLKTGIYFIVVSHESGQRAERLVVN